MAGKNLTPKKFQMVTTNYKVAGGANRNDAAVTVYPSGRAICNRGSTDLMDEVAGSPASSFLVKFGVDPETMTVAVYLADSSDKGAMRTRRYATKGGSRLSFHMGGVWQEHPKLRPDSTMDYLVSRETDADGVPYLEISFQAGLVAAKGKTAATVQNPR